MRNQKTDTGDVETVYAKKYHEIRTVYLYAVFIIVVQVKAKALILAEMNSFLQKRTEEDEKVNRELEHTLQQLQR